MGRYSGRIVTKSPATPAGPSPLGAAPGLWTRDQVNYWMAQGRWPVTTADPYFSYVSCLMSTTATNAQQNNTFLDSSTNNFTITRFGNTTQGSFSPFKPTILPAPGYTTTANGGSGYFDGSGDLLSVPSNAAFSFGTGDFTIECWLYFTSYGSGNQNILDFRGSAGSGSNIALYLENVGGSGTKQLRAFDGAGDAAATASNFPLNTWSHVAITRSSNSFRFFVNGAQVGSTTTVTTNYSNTAGVYVGAYAGNVANFFGYLSNVRVVKGTAVYTAAFTPPTAPVTAISGTSILCNFTNAGLYDAAMQNNMETVGNAQVSTTQAKFGTTSAYFDGSGDGLLCNGPSPSLVNANFTWECWVNFNSLAGNPCLINVGTAPSDRTLLYFDATNGIRYAVARGNVDQISIQQGSTSGWSTGVWYHVALVRNGNTYTIYRDGTSVATGTSTYAQSILTTGLTIGYSANGLYLNGYLDDVRVTNGYARYTANFTPPTAALPVY